MAQVDRTMQMSMAANPTAKSCKKSAWVQPALKAVDISTKNC
jgi:hypothetical protein